MKFDQPTTEAILKDISDEVPYEIACESNGVSYDAFKMWLRLGKADLKEGKNSKYVQFLTSVKSTQKERIKNHLARIGSGEKGHRGSEWVLERAYWMHFSSKIGEIELNERVEKLELQKGVSNAVSEKAEKDGD